MMKKIMERKKLLLRIYLLPMMKTLFPNSLVNMVKLPILNFADSKMVNQEALVSLNFQHPLKLKKLVLPMVKMLKAELYLLISQAVNLLEVMIGSHSLADHQTVALSVEVPQADPPLYLSGTSVLKAQSHL